MKLKVHEHQKNNCSTVSKNITFLCHLKGMVKGKNKEIGTYAIEIPKEETANKNLEKATDVKLKFQFIDIDTVFAN